ncbi:MAG: transglycosylase domain-containing protein [Propionicimonas sp.]|uniref:transglycosylase domain-containing protein n=1 Tax=Propionicimonas sp. TaxID=1955623 RepID=UPI003D13F844
MADPKRSAGPRSAPKAKTTRKGRKKTSLWVRIPLWILSLVLVVGVIGAGVVAYAYTSIKLPDPNSDFSTNTTFVYYNDGKTKIGSFQVQNRQSISYEDMPQHVKDAIVAAENRTFWTDPGISPTGLLRAALGLVGLSPADATATGGGSTITQQYIKVMYLSSERSFTRKAKELLLATKMGQELSKQDILEGYLNTVYFGRGAYGIEAAAQAYFKVSAAKLTLAQSVALAAIVNSPGNLDPANGDQQAADLLERYQYTLNGMVDMGAITASERAEIYDKLPKFPKVAKDSAFGGPKGFLLTMVKNELLAKGFTEEQINGGGLKVVTTFDATAQDAAVEAAQKMTLQAAGSKKAAKNLHAGLASIDNATGGVLALYGGPDFLESQWNWATNPRPTGSTFKTYAFATALANGWTFNDKLNGSSFTPKGDSVPVRNADGNFGMITMQYALTHSVNSAFVDLVTQIEDGPSQVQRMAEAAGVPEGGHWDLSNRIALGNTEVSPLNQAAAYSTFANQGLRRDAHVVKEVFESNGDQSYAADTEGSQTIDMDVAIDTTQALTKVTQDGTGSRAAYLGYPVAGKTGTVGYGVEKKTAYGTTTVRETRAAWFVGYTAQVTTAVMYVKGKQGTGDLGSGFYGATWPLSTWLEYMKVAMEGKDKVAFEPATTRTSTQSPTPKKTHTSTATASATASATDSPSATDTPTTEPSTEPTTTEPTTEPTKSSEPKPTSSSSGGP